MFVIRASMAPYTHNEFALGAASGGRICFESLESVDIEGSLPVSNFCPSQVLHFCDLEFVAGHLG
jgi:hypothetical protein